MQVVVVAGSKPQAAPGSQAFPQAPQFASVARGTQTPPQRSNPAGQEQAPEAQCSFAEQTVPHPDVPQCCGSVAVSAHTPPQSVPLVHEQLVAGGQPQTPFAQVAPAAHAFPHTPQFSALARFTHAPEQRTSLGEGQVHLLPTQVVPAEQPIPHPPQFAGSVVVSAHCCCPPAAGQTCPPVQLGHVQLPAMQTSLLPQAWPHPPQFAESLPFRSTQAPPQSVSFVSQEHVPFWQ
jgi:hypothetical protein